MPIYEYACTKCGKKTEIIQRMGDAPPAHCPHCGGKVKKVISAPAIQFKGSGWYVTDYGSGTGKHGFNEQKGESEDSGGEKTEAAEKSEKSEKSDKSDKSDKSEKSERSEKGSKRSDRAEKSEKSEKRKSGKKGS